MNNSYDNFFSKQDFEDFLQNFNIHFFQLGNPNFLLGHRFNSDSGFLIIAIIQKFSLTMVWIMALLVVFGAITKFINSEMQHLFLGIEFLFIIIFFIVGKIKSRS